MKSLKLCNLLLIVLVGLTAIIAIRPDYKAIEAHRYYIECIYELTWQDAVNYCKQHGMSLFYMKSKAEEKLLLNYLTRNLIKTKNFWTAGQKIAGPTCMYLNHFFGYKLKWTSAPCTEKKPFICEQHVRSNFGSRNSSYAYTPRRAYSHEVIWNDEDKCASKSTIVSESDILRHYAFTTHCDIPTSAY